MALLTPHDTGVIAELAHFPNMPDDKRDERLASLQEPDAREVAEVIVGLRDDSSVSPEVLATVERYRAWVDNNRRLSQKREARRSNSNY